MSKRVVLKCDDRFIGAFNNLCNAYNLPPIFKGLQHDTGIVSITIDSNNIAINYNNYVTIKMLGCSIPTFDCDYLPRIGGCFVMFLSYLSSIAICKYDGDIALVLDNFVREFDYHYTSDNPFKDNHFYN